MAVQGLSENMPGKIDRNLETKHAAEIIHTLENARARDLPYVVFEIRPMDIALHPAQFEFFKTEEDALDDWELKTGGGYLPGDGEFPVYCRQAEQLLKEIRQANSLTPENNKMELASQSETKCDRLNDKAIKVNLIRQNSRKKSKGRKMEHACISNQQGNKQTDRI